MAHEEEGYPVNFVEALRLRVRARVGDALLSHVAAALALSASSLFDLARGAQTKGSNIPGDEITVGPGGSEFVQFVDRWLNSQHRAAEAGANVDALQ